MVRRGRVQLDSELQRLSVALRYRIGYGNGSRDGHATSAFVQPPSSDQYISAWMAENDGKDSGVYEVARAALEVAKGS
jgi:hypothetical protein